MEPFLIVKVIVVEKMPNLTTVGSMRLNEKEFGFRSDFYLLF